MDTPANETASSVFQLPGEKRFISVEAEYHQTKTHLKGSAVSTAIEQGISATDTKAIKKMLGEDVFELNGETAEAHRGTRQE